MFSWLVFLGLACFVVGCCSFQSSPKEALVRELSGWGYQITHGYMLYIYTHTYTQHARTHALSFSLLIYLPAYLSVYVDT